MIPPRRPVAGPNLQAALHLDLVVLAQDADHMDEVIRAIEHGLADGWKRDRVEERSPRYAMPPGSIVLVREDAPGRPNARVIMARDGAKLRSIVVGPLGPTWFLAAWGFALQANRDAAQSILARVALMDLAGLVLAAANSEGAITSIEPVPGSRP